MSEPRVEVGGEVLLDLVGVEVEVFAGNGVFSVVGAVSGCPANSVASGNVGVKAGGCATRTRRRGRVQAARAGCRSSGVSNGEGFSPTLAANLCSGVATRARGSWVQFGRIRLRSCCLRYGAVADAGRVFGVHAAQAAPVS